MSVKFINYKKFFERDPQFNDLTNIRIDYVWEIFHEISVIFESESFEQIAQIIQDNKLLTPQEKKFIKDSLIKGRNVSGRKTNILNALCVRCQSELSAEFSCLECIKQHIKSNFSKWTSGDKNFDLLIQYFQLRYYARTNKVIEWVPFERFQNIEVKATGGFGIVYVAKWLDGSIISWDAYKQKFLRGRPGPFILKSMNTKNIENININFYKEITLALNICNGTRPEINFRLPSDYEEMMKRCWNADISCRPSASELLKFFTTNLQKIYKNELIIPELDDSLLVTSDNDLTPKIINT
ncbi:6559_t:CDS:2, partial [Racocetra fulgida]